MGDGYLGDCRWRANGKGGLIVCVKKLLFFVI